MTFPLTGHWAGKGCLGWSTRVAEGCMSTCARPVGREGGEKGVTADSVGWTPSSTDSLASALR